MNGSSVAGFHTTALLFEDIIAAADGSHRHIVHSLHGPIGNIPAHFLSVEIDDVNGSITVEGRVVEGHLFASTIEMTTRYTTFFGSNRLVVRDEFRNLGDRPIDFQVLYHWNFGPPYLDAGANWSAPLLEIAPRTAGAASALNSFNRYEGPTPGFSEQVYLCKLIGDDSAGRTLALLRDSAGEHGVSLRFSTAQLPCFIVWKNTAGARDGYVTGLEPSTNYPNPFPFEKAQGRLVALAPDSSYIAETTLEILNSEPPSTPRSPRSPRCKTARPSTSIPSREERSVRRNDEEGRRIIHRRGRGEAKRNSPPRTRRTRRR